MIADTAPISMASSSQQSLQLSPLQVSQISTIPPSRVPKCARCRCHGIDRNLKGHKERCQFKDCTCRSCLLVVERQKITAARVAHLRQQRKIEGRRNGRGFADYHSLTDEEDYLLTQNFYDALARRKQSQRFMPYSSVESREGWHPGLPTMHRSAHLQQNDNHARQYRDELYRSSIMVPCSCCRPPHGPIKEESPSEKHIEIRPVDPHPLKLNGVYSKSTDSHRYSPKMKDMENPHPLKLNGVYTKETESHRYSPKIKDMETKPLNLQRYSPKVSSPVTSEASSQSFLNRPTSLPLENTKSEKHIDKRKIANDTCIEVLTVMFPEFDSTFLGKVTEEFSCNIQSVVDYLLGIKKSMGNPNSRRSAFQEYRSPPPREPSREIPCSCCYR